MSTTTMNNIVKQQEEEDDFEVSPLELYLCQLTPIEFKAMDIAKRHLGSSFNIMKSNGFIEWKKKNGF